MNDDRPLNQQLLLDAPAAAAALSISPRKLWQLTKDGQLPHLRIGRRVLYDPAALQRWIADQQEREQ
jgi:excisionase family DNA binding protein